MHGNGHTQYIPCNAMKLSCPTQTCFCETSQNSLPCAQLFRVFYLYDLALPHTFHYPIQGRIQDFHRGWGGVEPVGIPSKTYVKATNLGSEFIKIMYTVLLINWMCSIAILTLYVIIVNLPFIGRISFSDCKTCKELLGRFLQYSYRGS